MISQFRPWNEDSKHFNHKGEISKDIMTTDVDDSASSKGYRAVWYFLKSSYWTNTQLGAVIKIFRESDAYRIKRQKLIGWLGKNKSSGPNYCWHFDRDDTLNPCGLSIQRLRESNADKMEYRKTLRLARRKYISPDPNYFWLIFALHKKWNFSSINVMWHIYWKNP